MKTMLALILLLLASSAAISDDWSGCRYGCPPALYSQEGRYLGRLSANPYDSESISNPYSQYGSPYSSESINNPYGRYGSPYSQDSARNPFGRGVYVIGR